MQRTRPDPIYLIDASVYVFRAYFSLPDTFTDPEGRPVNALYGFALFLADLLEDTEAQYVAVAFDESLTRSFRNELYPDYKANRELPPEDLEWQFELCRRMCRAFGVAEFASHDYEADDIIGTIARVMKRRGKRAVIVSRDKDLAQLLGQEDEFWDYGGRGRLAYTDIEQVFGVRPEQMADFLALCGDSVDNIPGVTGIGKKTAAVLLREFESLEAILEALDEIPQMPLRGAARIAKTLTAEREKVALWRSLTGIACDVPLTADERTLLRRSPDLDEVGTLCETVGVGEALLTRARKMARQYGRAV